MLFNSLPFILFFTVVFALNWLISYKGTTRLQNLTLLLASWFFYAWASWKLLPIILAYCVVFYYIPILSEKAKTERHRSVWFWLGIVFAVGSLAYFKYFNFFIEQLASFLSVLGLEVSLHCMKILMPLGLSFFTFRILSYLLDIHYKKISAEKDYVVLATYISFFPCILSGPIDRPNFMLQLHSKRVFDYSNATDGAWQVLWGLFKKMIVADYCASYVNTVWSDISHQSGSALLLAAIYYAFELYADFSGYTDMAIGFSRLLGIKVTQNFRTPFFALNIADFWRRWHISLTSWMTDYIFMPLNISLRNWGKMGLIVAIVINFVIVGVWHGAGWNYAIYGLYHGLLYIPLILSGLFYKKAKLHTNKLGLPKIKDLGLLVMNFVLVSFGFLIFRAENMCDFTAYISGIFSKTLFTNPHLGVVKMFFVLSLFVLIEWVTRENKHAFENISQYRVFSNKIVRLLFYAVGLLLVVAFRGNAVDFVYFQF